MSVLAKNLQTLRKSLRKEGLERASIFSWEKAAEETLVVFQEVYDARPSSNSNRRRVQP